MYGFSEKPWLCLGPALKTERGAHDFGEQAPFNLAFPGLLYRRPGSVATHNIDQIKASPGARLQAGGPGRESALPG